MSIKNELDKLKEIDVWSILLFVLYKVKDVPEYSSLSELSYILDKKNLVKFIEYFGGTTIKVPTIDELELLLYGLLLYNYIDIEQISQEDALTLLKLDKTKEKDVKKQYLKVKGILSDYSFTSRDRI